MVKKKKIKVVKKKKFDWFGLAKPKKRVYKKRKKARKPRVITTGVLELQPESFEKLKGKQISIKATPPKMFAPKPIDAPILAEKDPLGVAPLLTAPQYPVVIRSGSDKVYVLEKRWIENPETLTKLGFKFTDVMDLPPEVFGKYPEGQSYNLKEPAAPTPAVDIPKKVIEGPQGQE